MARRLSQKQAEALLTGIREGFVNVERKIIEFAQGEGWVALGYSSFTACWDERMGDLKLNSNAVKGVVVSAMLKEGASTDDITDTVAGVGPVAVETIQKRLKQNVPPDMTLVREYVRIPTRQAARTVHVKLTAATYKRYQQIAKRAGSSLEAEGEVALRLHFASLTARGRKSA